VATPEPSPQQEPAPPLEPLPHAPRAQYAPVARTSGLAIASFVLAIVAMVLCVCNGIVAVFPAIPAVVCGHLGRRECARDPLLSGGGFALAGLILGYINLALYGLILLFCVGAMLFILLIAALGQAAAAPTPPAESAPDMAAPLYSLGSAGPPIAMGAWMSVVRLAAKACLSAASSRRGSSARTPMAPQASAIWA